MSFVRAADAALIRRTGRHLRRTMVRWFSPRLLLKTVFMLVVARLFATYADRRERAVAAPSDDAFSYGDRAELWLDYVADLGDGWDSTTTIAGLLAQPALTLSGQTLPHGEVLVMGGDLTYPAASRDEYLHRLEAPYYSVLPFSPESAPRDLFVLPGNHDWYDGLAAFSRLFLQQRWFAGWRTRQTRSCFVLRLPQRWWFVAVDVQLDNDIDAGQLHYLQAATRALVAGDRVVLVSAVPFWLEDENSVGRRNLAFLERTLFVERGAQVYLSLAGDLHHYQRYARDDGAQRVTAGGGGAFLHGTAWQPAALKSNAEEEGAWLRQTAFPSPGVSRLALWRLLFFPFFNPSFSLFLGAILALLLWCADAASYGIFFNNAAAGFMSALWSFSETLPMSPGLSAAVFSWFTVFILFEEPPNRWSESWRGIAKVMMGIFHAGLHFSLALLVLSVSPIFSAGGPFVFFAGLFSLWLILSVICGTVLGIWMYLTYQLVGAQADAAFSACRIADWKNFLRIHVASDGSLTLYAIGVRRVCRRWRDVRPAGREGALVEPGDGVVWSDRAMLVDKVVIKPE